LKAQSDKRTLVVGAGGAGISSALLASLRGEEVTILESHSALGGCASWFRRGRFIFDAGATTLSGVGENEPLGQLFELLGKKPHLYPADPGIVFHLSSGKTIRYHRDFEMWMKELSQSFPGFSHRPFWELVRKINKDSWSLLRDVKTFPFTSFRDLKDICYHPRYIKLLPHLFISTELTLKKYGLDHAEYLELINGILLISAQAHSEKIPFIVGAMALSYPAETYAPVGGMKGLMDFFEQELIQRGVEIRKNFKITEIRENSVKARDKEVCGDKLIINLPVWNIANLYQGKDKDKFLQEAKARPGSWGALTLYFGMKSQHTELYHQIHLKNKEVKNYFVSFSVPGDNRAPEGFQSVSISTHVLATDNLDEKKNELASIIMQDFKARFKVDDILFFTIGTPKTFERYTGRSNGFVGGLPFLLGKNPLSLLSPLTAQENLFRVGDTVFPGQGLCGVVAGALNLHHRLKIKV
jgi:phytoene dehydrogenase-like protein